MSGQGTGDGTHLRNVNGNGRGVGKGGSMYDGGGNGDRDEFGRGGSNNIGVSYTKNTTPDVIIIRIAARHALLNADSASA